MSLLLNYLMTENWYNLQNSTDSSIYKIGELTELTEIFDLFVSIQDTLKMGSY